MDKKEEEEEDSPTFDHLHPRMIYEVMNFIKQKGSINVADMYQLAE